MTLNIKKNMQDGLDSGNDLLKPIEVAVSPDDYYMHPRLADDFEDLKITVESVDEFGTDMGARNYLFSGPAGTGKTLAAQVLAAELEIPLFDITGHVKSGQQVDQVFDELRKIKGTKGNLLAFVDEIDGMSGRDNIVDPLQYMAFTQFLSQLDGLGSNNGIFLLATSNRPNSLDEALRSRFAEEIEFLPPDNEGRYQILKIHANGKGNHKFKVRDEELEELAEVTYGYVGRDLKQVLNRAFTHAKRNGSTQVSYEDLKYGMKKTRPSAIRDMPFVEPAITLDDLAGYQDHKDLLKSIMGHGSESVLLFYGPKGTGKTAMTEALAGEYGYNFILLKGSELESKWVGESKDRVEKVIKKAKQLSPCILCFDEISSFVELRGVLSHKTSQTGYMQSILSRPPEGVYIVATDNNPEFLHGPFMDRFIHKIYFGMPSEEEQKAIWKLYAPEIDPTSLVRGAELSGRDIAHATKKVLDYGLKPEVNIFAKMLSKKQSPDPDTKNYQSVCKNIGDSVADFRALREFMKK
jgi:transitional endoplasmic reticulum ATPase